MLKATRLLCSEGLGPFKIKSALEKLPNVSNIKPEKLGLPAHPRYRYPAQSLLRAIDVEQRIRQENEYTEMIMNGKFKPGSIVLVDQVTSRVNGQQQSFAGVLLGIRKRGILSSIVLKSVVSGVEVEMRVPIYSPLVTNIVVLKESPLEDMKSAYWLRDTKHKDINFEDIDHILVKYKNEEARRLKAIQETK